MQIIFGIIWIVGILSFPVNCYVIISHVGRHSLFIFVGTMFNFEYFMPYIILIMTVMFYLWNYWSTLEKDYFSLKMTVFLVCRKQFQPGVTRLRIYTWQDPYYPYSDVVTWKYHKNKVPLMSDLLYHKIRAKYLPYNSNLFHFALKSVAILCFLH